MTDESESTEEVEPEWETGVHDAEVAEVIIADLEEPFETPTTPDK